MRQITLGSTGITSPQNAFGALPDAWRSESSCQGSVTILI